MMRICREFGRAITKAWHADRRNPKATFSIEGYTVTHLAANEYNLDLSQRRADSVKNYLVSVMGINSNSLGAWLRRVEVLVAPRPVMDPAMEQAEIVRQQPNRRVVIVVHTSGE